MICKCCVTCVCCEIILLLSLLLLNNFLEMPPARSSVNMPRDKALVGIRCIGCAKVFKTSLGFDQHRRSNHLRGTACYALPEKTRSNLYAVKRHNMSTANRIPPMPRLKSRLTYFTYFSYFTFPEYCTKIKSQTRPLKGIQAGFEMTYF